MKSRCRAMNGTLAIAKGYTEGRIDRIDRILRYDHWRKLHEIAVIKCFAQDIRGISLEDTRNKLGVESKVSLDQAGKID